MPAQSTSSADKKRLAQEARRKAALKSRSRAQARGGNASASANPASGGAVGAEQPSLFGSSTPAAAPAPVQESQQEHPPATTQAESAPSLFGDPAVAPESVGVAAVSDDEGLDALCEIADTNPSALGPNLNSVRQLCRNRRQAMATKGKAAVPAKSSGRSRTSTSGSAMAFAAGKINGRDLARIRRQEMANKGRGDAPASRPSGRVRPTSAPPKVEVGTTLSGEPVTGTQVERTQDVTGNESGTCRVITGTEYVGTEQFETFCGAKPEPNPPKVGLSITTSGRPVTGTEVGRSEKVTGDEHGSCTHVTGSEYIGADNMSQFCGVTPSPRPAKVMRSQTDEKQISVTGSDEARVNPTTGNEAGAGRKITGDQYADAGAAKMTINGPSKVALTHTIAGQPVTGTEVGRSTKVTGDEYGSCRPITGTEYLSNEQFTSVCGTIAEPHPAKVGIDNSQRDQRITGALVDRTDKVTGNEPGSCARLTGTQYGQSKLCGGAAPKVREMHTLSGNDLTGNSVDLSPKMTGDEQGGCLPVTGTEYYGQEQFAQCPSIPQAKPPKVEVEHTLKGEHVSGTMLSATDNVTGNEHGANLPVSGTPYVGIQAPHDHGACCDACAARDAAKAAGMQVDIPCDSDKGHAHPHEAPVAPVLMTPTPQQAHQPAAPVAVPAPQHHYPVQQAVPMAPAPAPQDFSILSPARAAHITGSRYGGSRVTGPGDMAYNRVSGTPEFRYPDLRHVAQPAPAPVMSAPAQPAPVQAPAQGAVMQQQAGPAEQFVMQPQSQRITGEGREDGIAVTGDNWGRVPGMTGTEGHVVQARNPSLRGAQMHQPLNNAHLNKGMERPDAPQARVTGSSGNTSEGAVITVSGGARG